MSWRNSVSTWASGCWRDLMGNYLSRRAGRILDDARVDGVATVLFSCRCNPSLICHCKAPPHGVLEPVRRRRHGGEEITRGARTNPPGAGGRQKPTRSRSRRAAGYTIGDLPEELLSVILSKLDTKQAARTSVLSSAWRHVWKFSSILTLDIFAICACIYTPLRYKLWGEAEGELYPVLLDGGHCIQRFIDIVNSILRQHRGNVVELLDLRLDLNTVVLVDHHLDDWVRFAVSSGAKSVILHVPVILPPPPFYQSDDDHNASSHRVFPVELLDAGGGISRLEHIQLSYVLFKVPPHSQFIVFPSLTRLVLCSVRVSASDLQNMLSKCPILECLDLCMANLYGGAFEVDKPLSRLVYLRLACCQLRKIQLKANKLTTFVFQGSPWPIIINLDKTSELHTVSANYHDLTLEQAVSSLPNTFPMVQRLTLHCACMPLPKFPWRLENASMFSHLRYLQLVCYISPEDADDILSIAHFLEASPFLEELDMGIRSSYHKVHKYVGEGPLRSFPQGRFKYRCLKSLMVRAFGGTKSQLELMVQIAENAPALQFLTIDPTRHHVYNIYGVTEEGKRCLSDIRRSAMVLIGGKLSAKTKLVVL